MPQLLVAGAGVGGLAAGVALRKAGLNVTVFERDPELRTTGAGLTLWPNGVRVIYSLGLEREFDEISARLRTFLTLSNKGESLIEDDLNLLAERFGAPMAGVHRLELNAMLARALGKERPVRFGCELVAFRENDQGVVCDLDTGDSLLGDGLVGADGIHSTVRHGLFGEVELQQTGLVRWRGIFQLADVDVDPDALIHVLGDKGHMGWLGIGRGQAYWYATGEGLGEWSAFSSYFGSWTKSPVPAVLRATPEETIIRNELLDPVGTLDPWGAGKITLLGDAAHPMMPGMAQGACQALEDAKMLARCISTEHTLESGFRAYEVARTAKANRVVELSRYAFNSGKLEEAEPEALDSVALVDAYYRDIEKQATG